MAMKAEIISVGDELTSGQRLDTNSQIISCRLGDLGIGVGHHTTVGDDLADNIAAFRIAASRSDIVIISGGLGPTADDLTREAMAAAFGQSLEFRPEAMEHIENLFKSRSRTMPERNRVQAMFPQTSRIIPNPHGTAPGVDLEVLVKDPQNLDHPSRLFALPGVPAEMIQMLSQTVEPRLIEELGLGQQRCFFHSIKLFGIGESDVEQVIPDLISRDRIPRVGITVSKATITLRIAALAASEEAFQSFIQPTVTQIREAFGEVIFAEGELELQDVIHELLDRKQCTLSVVEVGSGCWVGQMLSQGVQPSNLEGLKHLAWHPELPASATTHGDANPGESNSCPWIDLALQSQQRHQTDYAMAVGVYPPNSSLARESALPSTELQVAIIGPSKKATLKTKLVSGHPELFYQRLAKTALDLLRKELLDE
jgi:nicotinamide-nucleotide amidase